MRRSKQLLNNRINTRTHALSVTRVRAFAIKLSAKSNSQTAFYCRAPPQQKQGASHPLFQYAEYMARQLKLDMSRGKPAGTQLDVTNGILDALESYITEDGLDARNYGVLDGIPEAKRLFSELLNIPDEKIIIGGGVAECGELLLDPIRRTINDRAMKVQREAVEIVPAELGNSAGVIGASMLVEG